MTGGALMSPGEAVRPIAEMFGQGGSCKVAVREDRSFDGSWWPLGDVSIDTIESNDKMEKDRVSAAALVSGAFDWRLPDEEDARRGLCERLGGEKNKSFRADVNRALDDVALIAVRAGLLHPVIDAAALEEMPFRRSTTVVSDTSGVLQGALTFVCRNLSPVAKIKIPSVVNAELVASSDRFFARRRSARNEPKHRVETFHEHIKSQGGQRVLLRLELHSDIEVERTRLSDININDLDLSHADRRILEDALRHQAQSGPDHRVRLLTGDQGLARMALAEGVTPIYFSKTGAADFFGSRLTGQTFDPFSGDVQRTSFVSVLWESAAAFGAARLENDKGAVFEIVALGAGPSWSPYHSTDDLLWCKYTPARPPKADMPSPTPPPLGGLGRADLQRDRRALNRRSQQLNPGDTVATGRISFRRFDVGRLFRIICALDDSGEMDNSRLMDVLNTQSSRGGDEYRRFLVSADLIAATRETWAAKPGLRKLSIALRNSEPDDVRNILEAAPSFSAFATHVRRLDIGRSLDSPDRDPSYGTHGATTYRTLGEITRLCAPAFGEGTFATLADPDTEAFAEIALKRFSALDRGDGLVAVGAWLETMIRDDGIHPEVARRKLERVNVEGLLRMSTEGSTPELRYDNRVVHVLRAPAGEPVVERVRLYRGDYLIPGKASVSLRIEGAGR